MRGFAAVGRVLGAIIGGAIGAFMRAGPRAKLIIVCILSAAVVIGCLSSRHDAAQQDSKTARVERQWYLDNKRESERLAHMHYKIPRNCQTTTTTSTTTGGKSGTKTTNTTKKVCK